MISTQRVAVADETQVGVIRREVLDVCRRHGVDEVRAGKVAIVATELGHNLIRHAGGGEILLREISGGPELHLELISVDRGPGIRNVPEALRDGYSTIGTAGSGLGSVRRMSDRFDIFSQPDKGTVVWTQFGTVSDPGGCEIGAVSVALEGEAICGDAWDALAVGNQARFLVADGLGHGAFAGEASREAVAVFRSHPGRGVGTVVELMHSALSKTRGAAASVVEIAGNPRQIVNAGVGNISVRVVDGASTKGLISENGTLGASVRRVQEQRQAWPEGALLVLHSDGIGTQWNLGNYPGLASRHPGVIAAVIYRDFRRERDDATVVVVRTPGGAL